jgi:type VI secretion system protein ImpA
MIPVEDILQPVSPENPCGAEEDINLLGQLLQEAVSNDAGMLLTSGPKIGGDTSQEAKWQRLHGESLRYLQSSKDIEATRYLTLAECHLKGADGTLLSLKQGLRIVEGLVCDFWDSVHPQERKGDGFSERIITLKEFASPKMLDLVDKVPVFPAKQRLGAVDETFGPVAAQIRDKNEKAKNLGDRLRDCVKADAEFYKHLTDDAETILGCLEQIENQTKAKTGRDAELSPLRNKITALLDLMAPFFAAAGEARAKSTAVANTASHASTEKTETSSSIHSREDVIRWLDKMVDFYVKNEPGSPVPYLLQRVRRIVPLKFIDIINEFGVPAAQFEPILGKSPVASQ